MEKFEQVQQMRLLLKREYRCESGAVRTSTVFADEKYSLKAAIALLSEKVYFKVEALAGRPAVYMVFAVL